MISFILHYFTSYLKIGKDVGTDIGMGVFRWFFWLTQFFRKMSSRISVSVKCHGNNIGLNQKKDDKSGQENKTDEYKLCLTPSLERAVFVDPTPDEDELKESEGSLQLKFIDDGDKAYLVLLNAFKYLSFNDLLSAARVSKLWNLIASDDSLWKTVKMKHAVVTNCHNFAKSLEERGTRILDVSEISVNKTELCITLSIVKTLKKIDLGHCSSEALAILAKNAPQLTSLTAFIADQEFCFKHFSNLKNLTELKLLGSSCSLSFSESNKDDVTSCFKHMKNLTFLSLTGMNHLHLISYISSSIVSLALGQSCKETSKFLAGALPQLVNLKNLRLEHVYRHFYVVDILKAISLLPHLTNLELLYIDLMEDKFEIALSLCTNLNTLIIFTTPKGYTPLGNGIIYTAVCKLKHSLKNFVWGFHSDSINDNSYNFSDWPEGSYILFSTLSDLEGKFKVLMPQTNIKIIELPLSSD